MASRKKEPQIENDQILTNTDQIADEDKKEPNPEYSFNLDDARDFILTSRQQAEDEYRNVRAVWDDCWAMYINYQDTSKKEDWQSKVFLSELYPAIKKATSLLKRILFRARRVFDLKDPLNEGMDSIEIAGQERVLDYWLNSIGWIQVLGKAIESGLVFGLGIIKLWWEPIKKTGVEVSKQTKVEQDDAGMYNTYVDIALDKVTYESSRLAAEVVDPRQTWFDKAGTFFIEESYIPVYMLEQYSKKGPNGEAPLYDAAQVKKLKEIDYAFDQTEVERLANLNISAQKNSFKKTAHIYEYHGPLFARDGSLINENAYLVLANKEYILNPHRIDKPYNFYGSLEGRSPYIKFSPIDFLFRNEGQSMIEAAVSLQKALNNLINMSMDGLLWKLNKLIEVDPDLLRNPDVLLNLEPGRPILKKGSEQAVREIPFSDIPQGALASIEIIRRAIQNVDFITDIMMALNTRADTTATEVQVKTGEANAMWESIGITVEEAIKEFVEMTRQLAIMYWDDFRDPVLQEISKKYGLPLNRSTREEKVMFLLRNVTIRSGAVSEYFRKMEELKSLLEFLGICAKIPPLYQRLNLREFADRLLGYFAFADSHELLISEEEEQKMKQMEMEAERARANNLQSQANLNEANVQEIGMGGAAAKGGLPIPAPAGGQPRQAVNPQQVLQAIGMMGGKQ